MGQCLSLVGIKVPELELPEVDLEAAAEGITEAMKEIQNDADKWWKPRIQGWCTDCKDGETVKIKLGGWNKESDEVKFEIPKDCEESNAQLFNAACYFKATQEDSTREKICDTAWDSTLGPNIESKLDEQMQGDAWKNIPAGMKKKAKDTAVDKVREASKFDDKVCEKIDEAADEMIKKAQGADGGGGGGGAEEATPAEGGGDDE